MLFSAALALPAAEMAPSVPVATAPGEAVPPPAVPSEEEPGFPIEIHGFVALGWLGTRANSWLGETERGGTFDFNDLALHAVWSPLDRLRVGAQVYARDTGRYGNRVVQLDWGWVEYRASDALGIQLGRVKIPIGLYNESIDIPMGRVSVFLPVGMYDIRNRDTWLSTDGAKLFGQLPVKSLGSLGYAGFFGRSHIPSDGDTVQFLEDLGLVTQVDEIDQGLMAGGMLHWQTPVTGLALRVTFCESWGSTIQGTAGPGLRAELAWSPYTRLVSSAIYESGPLTCTAEWLVEAWSFAGEYSSNGNVVARAESAQQAEDVYGAVDWQVADSFALRASREVRFSNRQAPGESFDKRWSLAARYDFTAHWLIQLEGQLVEGTAELEQRDNPDGMDDQWQVLAIKTTVDF